MCSAAITPFRACKAFDIVCCAAWFTPGGLGHPAAGRQLQLHRERCEMGPQRLCRHHQVPAVPGAMLLLLFPTSFVNLIRVESCKNDVCLVIFNVCSGCAVCCGGLKESFGKIWVRMRSKAEWEVLCAACGECCGGGHGWRGGGLPAGIPPYSRANGERPLSHGSLHFGIMTPRQQHRTSCNTHTHAV